MRFFAGSTSGKGPALSGNCPGMQGVGSPLRFLESRIFQNANLRSGANYMTEALSSSFSWRAILARPSSLPEAWPQTLTRHRVFLLAFFDFLFELGTLLGVCGPSLRVGTLGANVFVGRRSCLGVSSVVALREGPLAFFDAFNVATGVPLFHGLRGHSATVLPQNVLLFVLHLAGQ